MQFGPPALTTPAAANRYAVMIKRRFDLSIHLQELKRAGRLIKLPLGIRH